MKNLTTTLSIFVLLLANVAFCNNSSDNEIQPPLMPQRPGIENNEIQPPLMPQRPGVNS